MKLSLREKILNTYLRFPIWCDLIVSAVLLGAHYLASKYQYIQWEIGEDKILELLTELISASIGIAGFVITALTIIVTFRSSSSAAPQNPNDVQSTTPLKAILNSQHYEHIVGIFSQATILLIFSFFYFSILHIFNKEFGATKLLYLIFPMLLMSSMALVRCWHILRWIIRLQTKNDT